jgi:putative oxygen-independent coproporphyrinogen III oxidase
MPSALPPGDPVPADGALPEAALAGVGTRPLGLYLHVPFCAVRCGYCDFNTYTALELGGPSASVTQASYAGVAADEVRLARRVLGPAAPPVSTVFVGGGTPTLLPADDLAGLLGVVAEELGLAEGAEVTTEANPDSVDPAGLARLREAGFTRVSFGMQSAVPHVLATLDRTHDPERVPQAVAWARAAGFDEVSLDLIYGTPGESLADWETSLDAALASSPDHVSAYALIVEDGTALARSVRRGEVAAPDDDDMADKYVAADERLSVGGLEWYELSNWARRTESRCRHNELYWTGADWWGVGPGAHSHVGGPLVERPAPRRLRGPPRGRREPRPGPRGARPRDPARRARAARDPAGRWPAGRRARHRRPGCARRAGRRGARRGPSRPGGPHPARSAAGGRCRPAFAALSSAEFLAAGARSGYSPGAPSRVSDAAG